MTSPTEDRLSGTNSSMAVKVPCRVATTANITLSGEQTIDGVAVVTGDRVLVKNQTSGVDNGIYIADTSTWARAPDFDGARDVTEGTLIKVNNGTVGSGFWYVSTTGTITPGTSSIAFATASSYLAVISAFMQTMLDDADAPAAQETLGCNYPSLCDFRLTLTSLTPVTTTDVTGAGTLYCTPYKGNRISLYSGTKWVVRSSAEFSLALTLTAAKPYDIFCYDNSGTPTLEALVWTDATTRATSLAKQNGILVKNGDATRRYLGTIYASGTNTTEDSIAKRYVWNYYHRARRIMRAVDTTANWGYTTQAWRQANAAAANQLDFCIGVAEDFVEAETNVAAVSGSSGTAYSGIGVDSTSANSANIMQSDVTLSSTVGQERHAKYQGYPGVGRHFLAWIEYGGTGITFLGRSAGFAQSGIHGEIWG